MKKILMGVGGVVLLVVGGIAAAASMQPDTLHVERTLVVSAAPGDVLPYAGDMAKWQQWNPWRELDPKQVETLSENTVGTGAWYSWKGDVTGAGRMEILESTDQKVVYDLHFKEPFESRAKVTIGTAADGDKTTVTWGFDSDQSFPSKVFGMFTDMDAMLGADFQRGLDKLKPLVEAEAARRAETERMAAEAAAAAAAAAVVDAAATEGAAAQ